MALVEELWTRGGVGWDADKRWGDEDLFENGGTKCEGIRRWYVEDVIRYVGMAWVRFDGFDCDAGVDFLERHSVAVKFTVEGVVGEVFGEMLDNVRET